MCLAVPGKILSISGEDLLQRSGRVAFGSVIKEVHLGCVPDAKVGDYVIVHVGLALSTMDESEAQRVFEYVKAMGELAELEHEPESPKHPPTAGAKPETPNHL